MCKIPIDIGAIARYNPILYRCLYICMRCYTSIEKEYYNMCELYIHLYVGYKFNVYVHT